MWSEHCSYKSSRVWLGQLPTTGPQVIQGPGENAGVVDIGDGDAVVFKMESHNHPSYIEPYQGAATGVGGIMRDVFTMGARPIANLNALRFGDPAHPRTRHLVAGVVAGIGGYGNCTGVPTVGGETNFDPGLQQQHPGQCHVHRPRQDGQDLLFGRQGRGPAGGLRRLQDRARRHPRRHHGVGRVRRELRREAPDRAGRRPLHREAADRGLPGADGVATPSSPSRTWARPASPRPPRRWPTRAASGIELDLDRVPQRETGMTAYEMMLSESQERMLMVLKPGREAEAEAVFRKWGLDFAVIGHTTDTGRMIVRHKGAVEADLPVPTLANSAPRYERPWVPVVPPKVILPEWVPAPNSMLGTLKAMMGGPHLASRRWIWEQYDHMVMGDTVQRPGGDAAVVRVHGTNKGIAATCDVTPRYVLADPVMGTKQAVAESWRNLIAVGADPLAITDNMNFGNPERPEIMGQFVGAIQGMKEACEVLRYPVVSGNVSLYNETNGVGDPADAGDRRRRPGAGPGADGAHGAAARRATSWSRSAARTATSASRSISSHATGRNEGAPPPGRPRRRDQGRQPGARPDPRAQGQRRARRKRRRPPGRHRRDGPGRRHRRPALPLRGPAARARRLVRRGPGPLRRWRPTRSWPRRSSSARACWPCRRGWWRAWAAMR